MSESKLSAIFQLKFYKKRCMWASQPLRRRLQRESLEADTSAPAASMSLRLRRSHPGSAHSNSSIQLDTTYIIEGLDDSNAPGAENLPQSRFFNDFVDSWEQAASCSAHDTETDGLYALESESEFCAGAGAVGAPHSSDLERTNYYCPTTSASAPETSLQLDTCTPYNINAVESDKDWTLTIPVECDVSRPPSPLPAPGPAPARPSPLCGDVWVSDLKWNTRQEWSVEELFAAVDVEQRAAAAHAHQHRTLVALCHRLAPHNYLPPLAVVCCSLCGAGTAVVCCPQCGARTDGRCIDAPAPLPPSRGRGHLPRMAPSEPLAVGQCHCPTARGHGTMATKYE